MLHAMRNKINTFYRNPVIDSEIWHLKTKLIFYCFQFTLGQTADTVSFMYHVFGMIDLKPTYLKFRTYKARQ